MSSTKKKKNRPSLRAIAKEIERSHTLVANILHKRGSYAKTTAQKVHDVIHAWRMKKAA